MSRLFSVSPVLALAILASAGAVAAGDGVVALQTAAPSCRTTTTPPPRYVDCENGTVTDNLTGLTWLADASCLADSVTWNTAIEFVAGLADMPTGSVAADDDCGLLDGSLPGVWRLASRLEWAEMVGAAKALGCVEGESGGPPAITNDTGTGCWGDGSESSFDGVQASCYWTSSTVPEAAGWARFVNLNSAKFSNYDKDWVDNRCQLWPVRGGQ